MIETDQITLHWERVANRHVVPRSVLMNAELDAVIDDMSGAMVLSLSSYVLTQRLDTHVFKYSIDVPATWWQMLKSEHAPGWFLRRYPVETVEHGTEQHWQVSATYPHADAQFLGQAVIQARQTLNEQWNSDDASSPITYVKRDGPTRR